MRVNLRALVVTVTILLLETSTLAICTCVRGTLIVSEIRGRVIAIYKSRPNFEEPIPNAVVKVLNCDSGNCQTIAQVTADENGRFVVGGVKSGKYDLETNATAFQTIVVGLKLSNGSGGKNKEIVMALEPDTFDCCVGEAKVRKIESK